MTMTEIPVKIQQTPNPNARKFIVPQDVKREGKVSYTEIPDCQHVPLAEALLRLANVTQVHFFENVITVTQNGASEWRVLEGAVTHTINMHLPAHDPGFADNVEKPKVVVRSLLPADVQTVEEILDRTIRPGLQADGGDVEVLELDGNILTIRYEGACGGCPSSMMGTLQAIEGILRTEYNPYLEVVAL
jgi:Fe-S cluster biogenesis protein NfuA